MQREISNRISKCNKCGAEIFWIKNSNNKFIPFNLALVENIPANKKYCDGFDNIKISNGKNKGYQIHFETCNNNK